MKPWAVVVAAGVGTRFGGPKHRALLAGRELWQWSVEAHERGGVAGVTVVGDVEGGVPGGERRRDSVLAGLKATPGDVTHVLVHDAARPLVSPALVAAVIAALGEDPRAGVVPAVPVRDTVKRVKDGRVVDTVDRADLVAVQTPQGFDLRVLLRAHHEVDGDASDDAFLVEQLDLPVRTIPGDPMNLKVTYPEDLLVAEALLVAHRHHGASG